MVTAVNFDSSTDRTPGRPVRKSDRRQVLGGGVYGVKVQVSWRVVEARRGNGKPAAKAKGLTHGSEFQASGAQGERRVSGFRAFLGFQDSRFTFGLRVHGLGFGMEHRDSGQGPHIGITARIHSANHYCPKL